MWQLTFPEAQPCDREAIGFKAAAGAGLTGNQGLEHDQPWIHAFPEQNPGSLRGYRPRSCLHPTP